MMVDTMKFCQMAGVEPFVVETWIAAGWLLPRHGRQGWQFSGIDLVRAQLILDLRGPLGVNEEGVAVVLHLVDQVHGLRRALRAAITPSAARPSSWRSVRLAARGGSDARHR